MGNFSESKISSGEMHPMVQRTKEHKSNLLSKRNKSVFDSV